MRPRHAIRPRSMGATRSRPAGAMADVAETVRFVAERDQDAARERWLVTGQLAMLLLVLALVSVMVAIQRG